MQSKKCVRSGRELQRFGAHPICHGQKMIFGTVGESLWILSLYALMSMPEIG